MATLFISDLHLDASRPDIGDQLLTLLEGEARDADALYILGDLFESWVGDDDPNEHYATIKSALRALVDSGVPVYFMHGNRDFMIGAVFASETGVQILPDPTPVNLHGASVLLSHGDALCTDDIEYQQIRVMVRNTDWQAMMLTKPMDERLAIAAHARAQSMERNSSLNEEIMDVNQGAVENLITEHGVDILLHGHTHRPFVHEVEIGDRSAKRIVLGDWYEQGSIVRWDENGFSLDVMARP
jgi:UDP-2,3-diacylglucosamine hydrolase